MTKKAARHSGEKSAYHECDDFVTRRVNAHGLRGDFIVMHGNKAAAVSGMDNGENDIDRDDGGSAGPKKIRVTRNAGEPKRSAQCRHVAKNDADDLAKTERDDRKIIAFQFQRWRAHNEP